MMKLMSLRTNSKRARKRIYGDTKYSGPSAPFSVPLFPWEGLIFHIDGMSYLDNVPGLILNNLYPPCNFKP